MGNSTRQLQTLSEYRNRHVKSYLKYLRLEGVLLIDMCSGLAHLECVEEYPRQTEYTNQSQKRQKWEQMPSLWTVT